MASTTTARARDRAVEHGGDRHQPGTHRRGESRLGAAAQRGADGKPDGTANVRFRVNLRNYGAAWLHNVQATDLMEGPGETQFGSYTAAAVQGPNQYTIVPGSVAIVPAASTAAAAASWRWRTPPSRARRARGNCSPMAPCCRRARRSTSSSRARINFTGRTGTLLNRVKASGALSAGGVAVAVDDSMNGNDPDPDGDEGIKRKATSDAILAAIQALDAQPLSLLTPYIAPVHAREIHFPRSARCQRHRWRMPRHR